MKFPPSQSLLTAIVILPALVFLCSCSNSPYPGETGTEDVILYSSFTSPPKDLDPQRTYTVADGRLTSLVYERLLGYEYLERPLKLCPELALDVPKPVETLDADGNLVEIRYGFEIQPGVFFTDDPCFPGGKGRELTIDDFIYAFKRLADEDTNCPVSDSFAHILGFSAFRTKLKELKQEPGSEEGPSAKDLYELAGEIEGIQKTGRYSFDLVMDHSYPQILYWLAMRFVCALPWEAVDYYDGKQHKDEAGPRHNFYEHPVGTGAYQFKWDEFDREARWVFVRNEQWWGYMYPDRKTPATVFPESPGEPSDADTGVWTEDRAGQTLGQVTRIEMYYENEALPRFGKFLQGYYDSSGVPAESFDQVISGEQLTPDVQEKGIQLIKDYGLDVYYIGFNMQDDDIGAPATFADPAKEAARDKYIERNRLIRQAMSLAVDSKEFLRIFNNKLGVPSQWLLPPGMFGYDPDYRNPNRQYDPELTRAKALLKEAGLEGGIDPDTGAPFKLTFDVGSAATRARIRYNFYIDAWKKLGLDVELAATDYNKFQKKMHDGNFQLFTWGWIADYPDPENFLFLLYGPNSGKYGERKPNHAWYENPEYDFYFKKMENLRSDESASWKDPESGEMVTMTRLEIIHELRRIFEEDAPWIPLTHSEEFILNHEWLKHIKPQPITGAYQKYFVLDQEDRTAKRLAWNKPVRWPAYLALALLAVFLLPGILTMRRERR